MGSKRFAVRALEPRSLKWEGRLSRFCSAMFNGLLRNLIPISRIVHFCRSQWQSPVHKGSSMMAGRFLKTDKIGMDYFYFPSKRALIIDDQQDFAFSEKPVWNRASRPIRSKRFELVSVFGNLFSATPSLQSWWNGISAIWGFHLWAKMNYRWLLDGEYPLP